MVTHTHIHTHIHTHTHTHIDTHTTTTITLAAHAHRKLIVQSLGSKVHLQQTQHRHGNAYNTVIMKALKCKPSA